MTRSSRARSIATARGLRVTAALLLWFTPRLASGAPDDALRATVFVRVVGTVTAARGLDERVWRESVELKEIEVASGSGVLVSPQGYVLTNVHVIEGQRITATYMGAPIDITIRVTRIDVVLPGGAGGGDTTQRLPASVAATDPELDLAVLFVGGSDLPYVPLGDSDAVEAGQPVSAIGYPFGKKLDIAAASAESSPAATLTTGALSSVRRASDGTARFLQTSASLDPGNSGGALIDAEGNLVGIVQSKVADAANIGFAIPVNLVKDMLIRNGLDRTLPVPLFSRGGLFEAPDKGVRFLALQGFQDALPAPTQIWSGQSLPQLSFRVDRLTTTATAARLEQALLGGQLDKRLVARSLWSRPVPQADPPLLVGKASTTDGANTRLLYAILNLGSEQVIGLYTAAAPVIAANESVLLESLRSLSARLLAPVKE